jgi:hypothetical protein
VLELAKRRLARVYQTEAVAPIHLEYTVLPENEIANALTSSPGEIEAAEAALDAGVARPGEDPLGPALDHEDEDAHSPRPASDDE